MVNLPVHIMLLGTIKNVSNAKRELHFLMIKLSAGYALIAQFYASIANSAHLSTYRAITW
jgi:hypothetical protein